MSIQSTAGYQQDYRNCTHSLSNSFSSMYQPQAQDPTGTHNPSCSEPPYDNYHMSLDPTNASNFDSLLDTEACINQSMATPKASDELYHGLSDIGVPSIRPPTIQCDPWCSAAMSRQVHSSDLLSWDNALARGGAKLHYEESNREFSYLALRAWTLGGRCLEESLPVPHHAGATGDALDYTPFLSPTTALVTGDLAGSTRPNDGSLMAMPEILAKDDHLQGVPLGIASPNCLTGLVHTPWNDNTMSSYPHLPLPKDDGLPAGLHVSGFALYGDGGQCHTLGGALKAEQGPSKSCVPLEYLPACRSNPRRKRRRFTNGEKAVISYKRKVGVCGDCRQAKRKCIHVQVDIENEATKSGAGVIKTQPQGSSVFDGPRRSKIGVERQDNDVQEQGV